VRRFRTIRISLTGRCDLTCGYCRSTSPDTGRPPEDEELKPEEVAAVARAAVLAGAGTVRLTGGEPLLRDDLEEIVARVRGVEGVHELALTTNAQRLAPCARSLREAGLDRVNVGLPSLRPETYRRMTGGELGPALEGVDAALETGLSPVKLNVVVTAGQNDAEIADLVGLARERPVEVRFIERMPFTGTDSLFPAAQIRREIARALGREGLGEEALSPTAAVFRPSGFAGGLGVISPVTEPFCDRCDRLRVTSYGKLRPCLSEPLESDLLGQLRAGAGPRELARELEAAFARKPVRHEATFSGSMRRIGG
jgi:cyclic pyranopterin phosphate synthase